MGANSNKFPHAKNECFTLGTYNQGKALPVWRSWIG
jgi:hypothetical protein